MSTDYLYDEVNYFITGGLGAATSPDDVILYDWNLGVTLPSEVQNYWKFDETTGGVDDALDDTNLTEFGTVPSGAGILGNARGPYTGSNYFRAGSPQLAKFSVEGWFKTSVTGADQRIASEYAFSGKDRGYVVQVKSDNTVTFAVFGGGSDVSVTTPGTYTDGSWHYFYAGVRANSGTDEIRLYVDDAAAVKTTGLAPSYLAAAPYTVGVEVGTGRQFQGLVDEMAFWDLTSSSLTWTQIETTITARYNSGAGKKYTV
jgi:hypothetical protein